MMRVLIDANIIADALLSVKARPHGDRVNAQLVLEAVARNELAGIITPVLYSFVVHVVKPRRADHRKEMEKALDFLMEICEWAPVTTDHYRSAFTSSFNDVEDGMQYFAASSTGRLDAIITRDIKGFKDHVNTPVMDAGQFVKRHLS
jgi:predicted nucleic acid-binding protein